jgi:6-phosphogluconolactonase (cycloisomerase 2 family)
MKSARVIVTGVAVAAVTVGLAAPALAAPSRRVTLYTETNSAHANTIIALHPDGTKAGAFRSGGRGDGAGLGSQGSVTVSPDGRYLFAVNAGSGSVTAFAINRDGRLRALATARTAADPVSVAVRGHNVYVVGSHAVTALRLGHGRLAHLADRPLSATANGPAQIAVTPGGRDLLITEKASNTLDLLPLDSQGRPGRAVGTPAVGMTPFGFAFGRGGVAVVSNASGGTGGASTVTGYRVANHRVRATTRAIPDGQTAACWVAVGPGGRIAYVENAGSGTVSTYAVRPNGTLTLVNGTAATVGGHAGDAQVTGRTLWVLDNKGGRIVKVALSGKPAPTALVTGLPASTSGLAATP